MINSMYVPAYYKITVSTFHLFLQVASIENRVASCIYYVDINISIQIVIGIVGLKLCLLFRNIKGPYKRYPHRYT